LNGESLDIQQTKLEQLKQLFPEVFTEDKIDWGKLRVAFSDDMNFNKE
jgi:adenine-specific DNA-methyltransferase